MALLDKNLEALGKRLERATRQVDRTQVERQIGRTLERNSRASGNYSIEVEDAADRASELRKSG